MKVFGTGRAGKSEWAMERAFAKMTPGQILLVVSPAGDERWTRTAAGFVSAKGSWRSRFGWLLEPLDTSWFGDPIEERTVELDEYQCAQVGYGRCVEHRLEDWTFVASEIDSIEGIERNSPLTALLHRVASNRN